MLGKVDNMASSLTSTFGVWLVTFWFQALLQGCGMLQVWLYFHWYKNDGWGIKAMVLALLVTETFQSIIYVHVTYIYLIDDFGNFSNLFLTHWQDSIQLLAMYLSAFIVQTYFGYCIYILNRRNKILPGIIFALALIQIGSGLAQTIRTLGLTSFSRLSSTKATTTMEAAAAFLCDVVITLSLVYNLSSRKTGIKSTNSLLESLVINAINRGALTAVGALLNLILFLVLPDTFYCFIGLACCGKLYMNSALATLNSRQHVYSKAHREDASQNSTPMVPIAARPLGASRREVPVSIVVTKESQIIADSKFGFKPSMSTFVDGMV